MNWTRRLSVAVIVASPGLLYAAMSGGKVRSILLILSAIVLLAYLFGGVAAKISAVTLTIVVAIQPPLTTILGSDIKTLPASMSRIVHSTMDKFDSEIAITTDGTGFRVTGGETLTDYRRLAVLIGGSTTEQIYLTDSKTTAYLLQDRLRAETAGIRVINTGVSGLRATQHLEHLRYFRSFDAPKSYFILMGINDWIYALQVVSGNIEAEDKEEWVQPDRFPLVVVIIKLQHMIRAMFGPDDTRGNPGDHYYASVMGQYAGKPKTTLTPEQIQDAVALYRGELAALIGECRAQPDSRCYFATQPTGYSDENFADEAYVETLWMTPPNKDFAYAPESMVAVSSAFNKTLLDTVENSDCGNCRTIDAAAALGDDQTYYYDDAHFTNRGAARLADIYISHMENRP